MFTYSPLLTATITHQKRGFTSYLVSVLRSLLLCRLDIEGHVYLAARHLLIYISCLKKIDRDDRLP